MITFRSYKNFDNEKFTQDLSEAPWHVGEVFDNLEDQVYYWRTLMANITDENLPLKKMRVRAKDVPYTLWICIAIDLVDLHSGGSAPSASSMSLSSRLSAGRSARQAEYGEVYFV